MERRFVTTVSGAIGWIAGFSATSAFRIPRVWYLPLEHRWTYGAYTTGLTMDLYGRLIISLGVAAAASVLGFALSKNRTLRDETVRLWTGWTAIATALAAALFIVTKYG
jgi:hypothetical protein